MPNFDAIWTISNAPLIGVFSCLVVACTYFFFGFCVPYWRIKSRLKKVNAKLHGLDETSEVMATVPEALRGHFTVDKSLIHVWREYEETLHLQYKVIDGEEVLSSVRSTVPAEAFFNTTVLVDTPLRIEFFKHLPGILTGIGIIGTFAGLILALNQFDITNPEKVKISLALLLHGVLEAFIASAGAIMLAMVITLCEKSMITKAYGLVEELVKRVDSFYRAGAGEEYLSRLVRAAEDNATQTAQMKDSFVSELKEILTNLMDRQTAVIQGSAETMSRTIGQALNESLEKPLAQIAQVVERASGSQTDNVNRALQDVMTAMIGKIEDTFGDQIKNMGALMLESTRSMEEMRGGIVKMVSELQGHSERAGDNMAAQLSTMMTQAEERQQAMQRQIADFLHGMKQQMEQVHSQSGQQAAQMLQGIQSQIGSLVEDFARSREAARDQDQQHQQQLRTETESLVAGVGMETQALISKVGEVAQAMQDSISQLTSVTGRTVSEMNTGAQTMLSAAERFTDAGKNLTSQFTQSHQLSDRMLQSSASLNSSAQALTQVVSEYGRSRDSLSTLVTSLQAVAKEAEEKAGVNRSLVGDMQKVAEKLKEVQMQTDQYLSQVSGVLSKGFNDFSEAVKDNLHRSSALFHTELSNSVGMLSGQMEQLRDALEDIPDILRKVA